MPQGAGFQFMPIHQLGISRNTEILVLPTIQSIISEKVIVGKPISRWVRTVKIKNAGRGDSTEVV